MNEVFHPGKKADILKNIFRNNYVVPREDFWLLITADACFKISASTRHLISHLPRKGPAIVFVEEMHRLGVAEPEKILSKLIEMKCLVPYSRKSWCATLLRYLLTPSLELISSNVQARLFSMFDDSEFAGESLFRFVLGGCLFGLFISIAVFFTKGFAAGQDIALSAFDRGVVFAIILLSIFVHEIGHSVFAHLHGIGFRPIGFSMYLMYPVFYANISGVGELPLKPKISINLAGIALQSCFMLGILVAWLVTGWGAYLIVVQYLAFLMMFNLNPLLNTDGYWCYKDLVAAYRGNRRAIFAEKVYAIASIGVSLYLVYIVGLMAKGVWYVVTSWPWAPAGLLGAVINGYILVIVVKGLMPRFKESFTSLVNS